MQNLQQFFSKTFKPFFLVTGAGTALSNAKEPFVAGFWIPFAVDITVVAYTIGYLAVCGFDQAQPRQD